MRGDDREGQQRPDQQIVAYGYGVEGGAAGCHLCELRARLCSLLTVLDCAIAHDPDFDSNPADKTLHSRVEAEIASLVAATPLANDLPDVIPYAWGTTC